MSHVEPEMKENVIFHLAAFGEALPGLNPCGAGRVAFLIDGGFDRVWKRSSLFEAVGVAADDRLRIGAAAR
ncbi:hypothetical protein ACFWQC_22205 [Nocardioides sp. NPDC058538]|uniref:hypothetical protein n=1 Tax=Nocardioides sp. NPDC058538 TaxID=3346542 RepID=UPI003663E44F